MSLEVPQAAAGTPKVPYVKPSEFANRLMRAAQRGEMRAFYTDELSNDDTDLFKDDAYAPAAYRAYLIAPQGDYASWFRMRREDLARIARMQAQKNKECDFSSKANYLNKHEKLINRILGMFPGYQLYLSTSHHTPRERNGEQGVPQGVFNLHQDGGDPSDIILVATLAGESTVYGSTTEDANGVSSGRRVAVTSVPNMSLTGHTGSMPHRSPFNTKGGRVAMVFHLKKVA